MRTLAMTLTAACTTVLALGCSTVDDTASKDEVRDMIGKGDHITDWCAEFDWYGDGECDEFCLNPDPDCEAYCGDGTQITCQTLVAVPACPAGQIHEAIDGCYGPCVYADTCEAPPTCGDGGPLLCKMLEIPCDGGLVREIVNGCYGNCVDPNTCEQSCFSDFDCDNEFCGWADDNTTRICKPYATEGESCGGFVLPSNREECEPDLVCVPSEPTGDVPGTCERPIHNGQCGDGSTPVCFVVLPDCEDGLVREHVNGCFGECVDPVTCLPPSTF